MNSVLSCTLAHWLVNYNAHAAEYVAEFLGHRPSCIKTYKSITLLTPTGAFIRCVQVWLQSRVVDIAATDELVYLQNQLKCSLGSTCSLWSLVEDGDSLIVLKQLFQWSPTQVLHCGYVVNSVCWHPSKNQLVSASNDTVQLWDLDVVPTAPAVIDDCGTTVAYCVSFNPSGQYLACCDGTGAIRIWTISNPLHVHVLAGHSTSVNSISWHPSRNWLLSGSNDQTIRIWDIDLLQCIHIGTGHTGSIMSVHWHPNGTRFVSGSDDGTIRIWNTTGTCLAMLIISGDIISSVR